MNGRQTLNYYSYVLGVTILLIIVALALGPLAPIDEPTQFPQYDLEVPVSLSFSGFILLMLFIISTVIFWGSKNLLLNTIIDSSALSFIIINYINFYVIYSIWKPTMYLLPFFIYIKYGNAPPELVFDFGQVALIIFFYRLYRKIRPTKNEQIK